MLHAVAIASLVISAAALTIALAIASLVISAAALTIALRSDRRAEKEHGQRQADRMLAHNSPFGYVRTT
jgi:hypothetical protein